MEFSIKDLLDDAVKRANIGSQVTAAQVVEAMNEAIQGILPKGRGGDAKAISYKSHIVLVGCLNSAVSQFLAGRKEELIAAVKSTMPMVEIRDIRTSIMHRFSGSDDMLE